MKTQLYVIYDRVAQESSNIMQAKSDIVALRLMEKGLEGNPDARDFVLYRIGRFDTEKATGEIYPQPEMVSNFISEKEVGE